MASHHSIGVGAISSQLELASGAADELTAEIEARVAAAGLTVVSSHRAHFDGGGLTLACILAESHLVLHLWPEEGYATLDLHVCDYRGDNRQRAVRLVETLDAFCFAPASSRWKSLTVGAPVAAAAAEA